MCINPFLAGCLSVVIIELLAMFLWAILLTKGVVDYELEL